MKRRRNVQTTAIIVLAAVVVGAGAWWYAQRLPKRFAPVVDGRLYRSGEVSPAHLERLQRDYGIRRVICLLNPDAPETQTERMAADELGLVWENVPLTGDGASDAFDRDRLLELLMEPNAPPTLVHCAAGVNRTGLAVGLYRIEAQGWSYEQVLEEMRAFDFEDLPKHENLRAALREAAEPEVDTAEPGS
jgi:protein tyrosine/serine phosphatase